MALISHKITPLSAEDKKQLLQVARQTLNDFLTNYERPKYKNYLPNLIKPRPVFVTLRDKKDGALRGCRGTTKAEAPLQEAVIKMAIASATDDPRFSPLILEDLPDIRIEINALTPLKKIKPYEVQVGQHGLMIVKGLNSGLLLPQVPVTQKWSQKTFLSEVCKKAGLPSETWREESGVTLLGFESDEWAEK